MDTVEAVNTHCKKVNDFRDSKMLPSATPMKIIPEEWRGVTSVVTPFGEQTMLTISEQGLYFFLGRSDKPKALPYQMWVAGDVANALGYVDTTQAIRMHCKKVNKFSYGFCGTSGKLLISARNLSLHPTLGSVNIPIPRAALWTVWKVTLTTSHPCVILYLSW